MRIVASPFREVRDDAVHVEEMVMRFGANPMSPRLQAAQRGVIATTALSLHGVVVRQDVPAQAATLGDASPGRGADRLAPIALRGALTVEVEGLSLPITLCGAARDLDPTPCLLPGDVAIASPLVWRDRDGGVHFVEQLTAAQVVELARGGPGLALPIAIGGRAITTLDAPLRFARPADLVYTGDAGDTGPALQITVERHGDRVIYAVDRGGEVRLAVVERDAARSFRIASRGGDGARGSDGTSGTSGSDGMAGSNASCPGSSGSNGGNGSDGGRGGDGGDGGTGGDGGDIEVVVRCAPHACSDLVDVMRSAIHSDGGAGGEGGAGGHGGAGGRGGAGGSGTTCTDSGGNVTSLSGGSRGSDGSSGSNGSAGRAGATGKSGQIRVRVQRIAG